MKILIDIKEIINILGKKRVIDMIKKDVFDAELLDLCSDGDSILGLKLRKYVKIQKHQDTKFELLNVKHPINGC